MPLEQVLVRLGVATLVGLLLGLDREVRGFPAGIRTHALVALSSAAVMVSALKLTETFGDADPLRAIQGLAQAIGFIAAGLIFAARDTVHNTTTAANIWLASALGIAAGAAHFDVVVVATGFGLVLLVVVGLIEKRLGLAQKNASKKSADAD
ncbi:MgtC/SapB family protein [Sphingosinicella sp. YJ22]|uniref:MgtC/SapB family protein n=1 Tax=Sphingosinicella sp. YJ22 TaxID=1104780 RepID=UPI00140B2E7C|nr:MgtC/SapB family protein [Sphingosinicella sp. YJ22]